jgi:hypothetical protein
MWEAWVGRLQSEAGTLARKMRPSSEKLLKKKMG